MFKYQFYDKHKYPLKTFHFITMPKKLREAIIQLHTQFDVVIRGGLAYIIASHDNSYPLRDVDLAMELKHKASLILKAPLLCDEVFLNKNTFGDDVVTLFWRTVEGYYKLDILLVEKLPAANSVFLETFNREIQIIDLTSLYYNRICKIAEKELRMYSDEKVMRHFHVVSILNQYFIETGKLNDEVVKTIGLSNWSGKMKKSYEVMAQYLQNQQLELYCTNLNRILQKLKDE